MASSSRTIWKGAITFGLVHIPVGLHTASIEQGIDFDWLDKRSMDPVGYKRINKKTGKEIDKENIVKGFQYESGHYVIVSPEEIETAFPKTTQTIEIQMFVDASDIPFVYLERPYYVAPVEKGHKVYALLRETLVKTGKIGIAKVVIATKQHLAALVPSGPVLVLNLMRWGDEVKALEGLDLPPEGTKAPKIAPAELKMAEQLVEDMTGQWNPEDFKDEFKHAVMKLVDTKVKAGKTETVVQPEEEAPDHGAEIIDLTELLQRSLKGGASKPAASRGGSAASRKPAKPAAKKAAPARKAAPAAKAAAKKGAAAKERKAA
ncbi:MAG: Ku protein [Comamonadaceae bacterium]|nr:MAG: Ku protein [Comamonadaceae bacterium]